MSLRLPVQRLAHAEGLPLPRYESAGAAGLDLVAANLAPILLESLGRALVPTGLVIQLPQGYEAQIRPRSGLALNHGVTVLNAPGTIDSDYRGEIRVLLVNCGRDHFVVTRGMRIAQMVIAPVTLVTLLEVSEVEESPPRRFGFRFDRPHRRTSLMMMLLSRRSLLAIAAVVDIALYARPMPVSAKSLAGRHNLPPRHLETVLQALVRQGILKGLRGPRGGYELARERRRITAGEIVRAAMTATGEESLPLPESRLVDLVVGPVMNKATEAFLKELDGISVDDLCRRAAAKSAVEREPLVDFTI